MDELKRCPFCGGEAEVKRFGNERSYIQCVVCGASTLVFDTRYDAVARWNNRYEGADGGEMADMLTAMNAKLDKVLGTLS